MEQENRIVYFLSHPIQYFSPLLKAIAKRLDLQVYYFTDISIRGGLDKGFGQQVKWDIPLLEGYNNRFLKNIVKNKALSNRFFDVFNPEIFKIIFSEKSKVIIVNGWTYSSTIFAIIFGKLCGKQIWLRAENPLINELRKSKSLLLVKKVFLKYILFNFLIDKFLYIGKESLKFFTYYGVDILKLVFTPYSVDNDFFKSEWIKYKDNVIEIRKKLELPQKKKIILFCGKYISVKRPLDLLKAFEKLNNEDYALVLVGEGALRPVMEQYIAEHRIKNVYLTGFINQSSISLYYAICDVFVVCSYSETWGLTVNEALNFGKPIVLSNTCGCASDLVIDGVNGYIFKMGNIDELAAKIDSVLQNKEFRDKATVTSIEIVSQYSVETTVINIEEALYQS